MKIRPLTPDDGGSLGALLGRQSPGYRADFHPFPDEGGDALGVVIASARRDCYRAVMYGEEWVAFYMLRGWDAGYERPSFGLLVDEKYSGKGIGTLCLHAAMSECRLMGAASCMLKVAPGNLRARAIYGKAGFEFESVCPVTGHEILAIRWAVNPVEGKTGEG